MDPLERFFTVVPQNVPHDPRADLSDYLRLYADEAAGMSVSSSAPAHAEWYVNTRLPKMRALQGLEAYLGIVGQPMGADPTALTNNQAGTTIVTGQWAQRAANAWLSTFSGMPLLVVDGIVGQSTIGALRYIQLRSYAVASQTPRAADTGQTNIAGIPMPTRSGPNSVTLSNELYTVLQAQVQVADPAIRQPPSPPPPSPPPATPDATPVVAGAVSAGVSGIGIAALFGVVLVGGYLYMRSH